LLSEPHNKLFKLIWQNKKCCDYKSWTFFFLQTLCNLLQILTIHHQFLRLHWIFSS